MVHHYVCEPSGGLAGGMSLCIPMNRAVVSLVIYHFVFEPSYRLADGISLRIGTERSPGRWYITMYFLELCKFVSGPRHEMRGARAVKLRDGACVYLRWISLYFSFLIY